MRQLFLMALTIVLAHSSLAKADSAYTLFWNPVEGPQGTVETLQECRNESWCRAAMEVGLAAAGFLPQSPSEFRHVSPLRSAEGYYGDFKPGSGERICRTAVTVVGINNATLNVREESNSIVFLSHMGASRTVAHVAWVEVMVTVHTVPERDFSASNCTKGDVLHDQDYTV